MSAISFRIVSAEWTQVKCVEIRRTTTPSITTDIVFSGEEMMTIALAGASIVSLKEIDASAEETS
jgi:hypothetical protein